MLKTRNPLESIAESLAYDGDTKGLNLLRDYIVNTEFSNILRDVVNLDKERFKFDDNMFDSVGFLTAIKDINKFNSNMYNPNIVVRDLNSLLEMMLEWKNNKTKPTIERSKGLDLALTIFRDHRSYILNRYTQLFSTADKIYVDELNETADKLLRKYEGTVCGRNTFIGEFIEYLGLNTFLVLVLGVSFKSVTKD